MSKTVKINILKTNINDVGFNTSIFANNLKHLLPSYESIDVDNNAAVMNSKIIHEELFNKSSNESITLMQLLTIGYVIIDDTQNNVLMQRGEVYTGSEIGIRLDKITRGIIRNYPINVNLYVTKLASDYKFSDLSNTTKLLQECKVIYKLNSLNKYKYNAKDFKAAKLIIANKDIITEVPSKKIFDSCNKFMLIKYNIPLSLKNINVFIEQLYSVNLTQIILDNNTDKIIAQFLKDVDNCNLYNAINKSLLTNRYRMLNEFNHILRILNSDTEYYKSVLKKIKDYSIKNIRKLSTYLSGKDKEKVSALLIKQLKPQNNCAHINEFKDLYAKMDKLYKGVKDDVLNMIKELSDYIEKDGNIFRCKKCKEFLYCQHNIDGLGLDYDNKQRMYNEYKKSVDEGLVFCKYCDEKLYRIYDSDIVDPDMFNIINRARALDRENTDEMPVIRDICKSSLIQMLSNFIFKADVSRQQIIKDLLSVVTPGVLVQMYKLKMQFNSLEYINHARMISFVFGFIYMLDTFLHDDNMTLRNVNKSQKDYLSYFGNLTFDRFSEILINKDQVRKYMILANEDTKSFKKVKNNYITKIDNVNEILMSNTYHFLYELFNLEHIQSGKDSLNEVEAFNSIVFLQNAKLETFYYDAYKPSASFWAQKLLRDVYEYLYDFSSAKNKVHNIFPYELIMEGLPNYKQSQFNDELQNKLLTHVKNCFRNYLINKYKTIFRYKFNHADIMAKIFPVNYIITPDGSQRKWVPEIKNGIAVNIIADDLKLSDKMPAAKLEQIKITALNKSIIASKEVEAEVAEENIVVNKNRFNIILEVDKKYEIGKIEYIGMSSGVLYNEFLKGNVKDSSIKVSILNEYIISIIKNYNAFKYNVSANDEYFDGDKKIMLNYTQNNFPDIKSAEFIREFNRIKLHYNANNLYKFQQNYLLSIIETLIATKDKVFHKFILINLNRIFSYDMLYAASKNIVTHNLNAVDQDVLGTENDVEKASNEDDGFVNVDDLDYDQDEDDIPEVNEIDD